MNELIIVNEQDEITGYGEKMDLHRRAVLHRAFSIFLFDREKQKMLLQKRAPEKYHSGGKWSNACCSHPYRGESWEEALARCLKDELAIDAPFRSGEGLYQTGTAASLKDPCTGALPLFLPRQQTLPDSGHILFAGRFHYLSAYAGLSEHEMDHVFLYLPDRETIKSIRPQASEIAEVKWVSIPELNCLTAEKPGDFSTWFLPAYEWIRPLLTAGMTGISESGLSENQAAPGPDN